MRRDGIVDGAKLGRLGKRFALEGGKTPGSDGPQHTDQQTQGVAELLLLPQSETATVEIAHHWTVRSLLQQNGFSRQGEARSLFSRYIGYQNGVLYDS